MPWIDVLIHVHALGHTVILYGHTVTLYGHMSAHLGAADVSIDGHQIDGVILYYTHTHRSVHVNDDRWIVVVVL